jgi:hypothetical protein
MRAQTKHITTLGFVASHKRSIKSGEQYEKYFDVSAVDGKETQLATGDCYQTLDLMKQIVRDTLPQTKKISEKLKGATVEGTCKNIWNFLYNHIQYKKDIATREQLRQPIRSWKDRKSGIDCDCYAIFVSSILTNLGIEHAFRMAGYNGGDFQHVYVVVKRGKTITIDPVLDSFNEEAPYTKKHDLNMAKITMLSGPGNALACNKKPIYDRLRRYMPTSQVYEQGYVPTREFLLKNNIPYAHVIDPDTDGGMFQITTATGIEMIKPIINKTEAAEILLLLNKPLDTLPQAPSPIDAEEIIPVETAVVVQPKEEPIKKKFPWLFAAVVALGVIIVTTKDSSEVKPSNTSLMGPPKKKKKKVKTLYA